MSAMVSAPAAGENQIITPNAIEAAPARPSSHSSVISLRSRTAAARVHADYDWRTCVQLAEQALVSTRDNAFPEAGCEALAGFMREFQRTQG